VLFRLFTVLAVLALAVSTWILSSPARRAATPGNQAAAELPGYYLKHAVMTDFDAAGVASMRLEAERIDQIGQGTEVALTQVRMHYLASNGQNWVIVGDTGRVESGGKIIDLQGHVVLRGESPDYADTAVVHADNLRYDVPESIATTPDDVHVDYGHYTLNGHGLKTNLKERTLHLDKVNGHFQP